MEPEELYLRLRPVIQTMPDLRQESKELPKWLGEAAILVEAAGVPGDATTFTYSPMTFLERELLHQGC